MHKPAVTEVRLNHCCSQSSELRAARLQLIEGTEVTGSDWRLWRGFVMSVSSAGKRRGEGEGGGTERGREDMHMQRERERETGVNRADRSGVNHLHH